MIFDKPLLSRSPILVGADRAGTSYSCYGAQNEHKNTQNNMIEGEIIKEMTVEIDHPPKRKGGGGVSVNWAGRGFLEGVLSSGEFLLEN